MDFKPARHGSEDVELSYESHLKDTQRETFSHDGASGVVDQDEREIRRMGKVSLYKVSQDSLCIGYDEQDVSDTK